MRKCFYSALGAISIALFFSVIFFSTAVYATDPGTVAENGACANTADCITGLECRESTCQTPTAAGGDGDEDGAEGAEDSGSPSGGSGLIIWQCAGVGGAEESCRDVNVILLQGIAIGKYLFGIIGAVALFFFIIGGFTIVTSLGNAEKAKKGYQMVFNAAIGMFIAFSAYILINFLLDALGVAADFRAGIR